MKKIIIVNNNMNVGGVQKSLCNLLWALEGKYDITLVLFRRMGEYAEQIPSSIKVVECESLFRLLGISQGQCEGRDRIIRGIVAMISRCFGRPAAMRYILSSQKTLDEHYDCAISFLHNGNIKNFYGGTQEFVLHKINANKKVAFLHCDYENCGANHLMNNRLIAKFDVIAACSDGCRAAFENVLPELAHRTVTVKNFHRFDEIKRLSEENPVAYDENAIHVVMVSRLAHEKAIERGILAIANARKNGVDVKLHIVGGGPMEDMLREYARSQGVMDYVCFYGEQANPYRYMKHADLFLLTSYHEAAPMVLEEARCLGLPILTVETTSSAEMVIEQDCGWVCDNDQQALERVLHGLLADKESLRKKKLQIQSRHMSNSAARKQFDDLVEE